MRRKTHPDVKPAIAVQRSTALFPPTGNRHGPDAPVFSNEVGNYPAILNHSKLLNLDGSDLGTTQPSPE
jgi:hypothetical protein